jgi:hypothetical protein
MANGSVLISIRRIKVLIFRMEIELNETEEESRKWSVIFALVTSAIGSLANSAGVGSLSV